MGVAAPAARARLERFLADAARAERATVLALEPLTGGAVQENWRLDAVLEGGPCAGKQAWVLRITAPAGIPGSHSRAQEFAILQLAEAAGIPVPAPRFLCRDETVLGREFFIMERLSGVAAGHRLVRDPGLDGEALVGRLGQELGRLHAIRPPRGELPFLVLPEPTPALEMVARFSTQVAALAEPHPVLDWALRWMVQNAPEPQATVLCHRDFRTGNYLVEQGRLTGLLDWEFASWGDPMEDIGWFCAKCWRFGANAREAGGIGSRAAFTQAYEESSGLSVDPESVHFWEVAAHLRWAVIALQQCDRHLSGALPSLELALTGRLAAEMELEILALTGRPDQERG
ncbi:MAG: phosphotransferase family protein [Alphaproteobacteria bacterium]|nr:phosphotransferase family protein [Alphaproteobacteria bacterium]